MRGSNPIRQGNQASDELGPVELVILGVIIAGLLVPPGFFAFHIVTGSEDAAVDWG